MLSDALRAKLLQFRTDRDWEQFHNLRTLSASLVLESAELLEHTQWARDVDLPGIIEARGARIEEEIADIAILLTYLCNDLGVEIERAVERKLASNAEKYPIAKARGTSRKYNELADGDEATNHVQHRDRS